MAERWKDMVDGLVQAAPQPGVRMSPEQLSRVAAEVDLALAELPPDEREILLSGVLLRLSAGAPTPARDNLFLTAGKSLHVQELARLVAKSKPAP